jgi:hypothetical protein
MPRSRAHRRLGVLSRALLLTAVLPALSTVAALATSHSEVAVSELNQIQGIWRGKQTDRSGTAEVEWVIRNAEAVATVRHTRRPYTATGTLSVLRGQLLWTAPRSQGKVVLHERDGQRWLKYELMGTVSGVPVTGEVYEVK